MTKDAGQPRLLPCPCGALCTADEDSLYPINIGRTLWRLHCTDPDCGWSVIAGTREEAIKDWARRATPSVGLASTS